LGFRCLGGSGRHVFDENSKKAQGTSIQGQNGIHQHRDTFFIFFNTIQSRLRPWHHPLYTPLRGKLDPHTSAREVFTFCLVVLLRVSSCTYFALVEPTLTRRRCDYRSGGTHSFCVSYPFSATRRVEDRNEKPSAGIEPVFHSPPFPCSSPQPMWQPPVFCGRNTT